jgi:signal transduction histidine kinase
MCPEAGEAQDSSPIARRSLEPELLSSVCHDLKAPLASLTMGVAFLRRAMPRNDDPTSRVIDALGRASSRMLRTIVSFSDLAKIQMGELELDVRRVALGEVMQGAFDSLLPEARADQLALTLEMDPSTGGLLLECDRARVIQTVEQLYACIVHAVSAPGKIRLSARRDQPGDAARLQVEASAAEGAQRELPRPELALARGLISLQGGALDVAAEGGTLRLSFSMRTTTASVARGSAKEASDGY